MKRTLVALVEDKPGTLNRIASLFRRRAFNIESLTVGHTEEDGVSRMTIVVGGECDESRKVQHHLSKLINVLRVEDVTNRRAVMHDLAMIKVSTSGGNRADVTQIVHTFSGRILDMGFDTLIAEATGPEEQIDRLIEVLRPFGILEMVRTGRVVMVCSGESDGERKEGAAWQE
jgi:acetolactate synthase-1/3 small subunit